MEYYFILGNFFYFAGEEKRVTHVHSGSGRLEYDPKSAGMPSYVMQEEFSRYQGFWWQPVSSGESVLLDKENGKLRKMWDVAALT